ncbi:MAG: phage holin family protein [Candidatus Woesebacteria bacterium]|nr:MAG: phage holin family protein [Candidatus Woesebacteria bacterium]
MRALLKHFIIDTVALYLISLAIQGIVFERGIESLLLTGFVLMLATTIIKPIINVLLLPINLITFGLFKWVAYAVTLYLVTLVVPGFKLMDFIFAGYSSYWIAIPAIHLTGALAFLAFSLVISLVSSIVFWIFK